ncbi:condensation domain-containing protein [Pedobacter panaciterrae]
MKRKLSLIEGTMYAGGQTAVNVVSSVTIKGTVQESELHASLLKIQARHPLLGSNVWEDEVGIPYFVEQNPVQRIGLRIVNRQTDQDWERESITECLTPFNTKNDTLVRLVWLKSESVSDLIVVGHHCICDGRSILNLMDETLSLLGDPEKEIGAYKSFSSIQDFIPPEIQESKANKLKIQLFSKVAKLALLAVAFKKEIKREKPFFYIGNLAKKNLP